MEDNDYTEDFSVESKNQLKSVFLFNSTHMHDPLLPVAIQLGVEQSSSDIRRSIVEKINHLIVHDFEKLVYVLYRIDVSEAKIDRLLKQFPQTDAAEMIADLLISREAEKIKSREQFKNDDSGFTEEEKW